MLIDFLATGEGDVAADHRVMPDWGDYPTDYLRILLNLDVLACRGYKVESELMKERWMRTYPAHAMPEFEGDIPVITKAILEWPYPEFGDLSLSQVVSFPRSQHAMATTDCARMLAGYNPQSDNVRTLFSAAAMAFIQQPLDYCAKDIHTKLLKRIPALQKAGVQRNAHRSMLGKEDLQKYDDDAGERLYLILSTRSGS